MGDDSDEAQSFRAQNQQQSYTNREFRSSNPRYQRDDRRGRGSFNPRDSSHDRSNDRGRRNDSRGGNFSSDQGNDESIVMYIDSSNVGRVVGRGGSKIRELQDQSYARINIDKSSGGEQVPVTLTGSSEAVQNAKQMIEDLLSERRDAPRNDGGSQYHSQPRERRGANSYDQGNEESVVMHIDSSNVGRVVGRGGSKIRELQDQSNARINIDKSSGGDKVPVTLTGSSDAVQSAKQMIEELLSECGRKFSERDGPRSDGNSQYNNY